MTNSKLLNDGNKNSIYTCTNAHSNIMMVTLYNKQYTTTIINYEEIVYSKIASCGILGIDGYIAEVKQILALDSS